MKKWTIHFLISALFIPGTLKAFEIYRAGARSAALGNVSATLRGSESLFHNQAGLTEADKLFVVLSCESRFLLKELSLLSAGIVAPAAPGTFGFSYIRFGNSIYGNSRSTLSFARNLGDRISAAVAFDLLSERFPENEHPFSVLTAETGIQLRCSEKCMAALWVFNPGRVKIKRFQGKESIPTIIRGGVSWQLKSYLTLSNELEYRLKNSFSLSTGMEITLYSRISFRVGLSSYPLSISGGIGLRTGKMEIDLSFYQHGYLGYTPVAGFTFNL